MLFIKNHSPRLSTSIVIVALISLAMSALLSAEPPGSPQVKLGAVKPLVRIGKETTGSSVNCFALSTQGDLVALGSNDGNIHLWSLAESKVVRSMNATKNGYIGSIAFSPDGKQLAFHADDHPVQLWDVESGAELARTSEEFSSIVQIRFSPSTALVALVDDDSSALIWNTVSGKLKKLHQPASALAFSPDGKTLALGHNTLQLVDVVSGNRAAEFSKLDGRATSLAFSRSGNHLLAVDSSCPGTTVRLVEIESGDEIALGEKIRFERVGAAFSTDGAIVAINDGFSEAIFWDAATGRKLITLPQFHRDANALVFTPDNHRLLSGRGDSHGSDVLVWNVDELLHATDKKP